MEERLKIDVNKLPLDVYAELIMWRAVNDYDGIEKVICDLVQFNRDYYNGKLDEN